MSVARGAAAARGYGRRGAVRARGLAADIRHLAAAVPAIVALYHTIHPHNSYSIAMF